MGSDVVIAYPSSSFVTEMNNRDRNTKAPPVDGKVQVQIGRRLRTAYDGVLNERMPDRMRSLLEALDRVEPQDDDARSDVPPPPRHRSRENRA